MVFNKAFERKADKHRIDQDKTGGWLEYAELVAAIGLLYETDKQT